MVTFDEAVAGFVPNVPVIPEGQPDAANVTPELKPFTGTTEMVAVPVDPALAEAVVELKVKLAFVGAVPVVVKE